MIERERIARIFCECDGYNPDHTLGGDGENFRWREYLRNVGHLTSMGLTIVADNTPDKEG